MSGRERERLALEVLDEVFGLGPLEPLLQDPTINDILVKATSRCMSSAPECWKKPTSGSRTTRT